MVEPQLPSVDILDFYVAVLRQMSNARTAIEEQPPARELDLLPGSGCSPTLHAVPRSALRIGSARIDGRFARASKSIPRRFGEAIAHMPRHQGHE